MTTPQAIASEARTWLGTPFHHQATVKGVGTDCAGLLRGVLINTGAMPPDLNDWPDAQQYLGYSRFPDGSKLQAAMHSYFTPVSKDQMQAGDFLLIVWDKDPQHVGIVAQDAAGRLTIIHALGRSNGRGAVVEHRIDATTLAKIVGVFRFEGAA